MPVDDVTELDLELHANEAIDQEVSSTWQLSLI